MKGLTRDDALTTEGKPEMFHKAIETVRANRGMVETNIGRGSGLADYNYTAPGATPAPKKSFGDRFVDSFKNTFLGTKSAETGQRYGGVRGGLGSISEKIMGDQGNRTLLGRAKDFVTGSARSVKSSLGRSNTDETPANLLDSVTDGTTAAPPLLGSSSGGSSGSSGNEVEITPIE